MPERNVHALCPAARAPTCVKSVHVQTYFQLRASCTCTLIQVVHRLFVVGTSTKIFTIFRSLRRLLAGKISNLMGKKMHFDMMYSDLWWYLNIHLSYALYETYDLDFYDFSTIFMFMLVEFVTNLVMFLHSDLRSPSSIMRRYASFINVINCCSSYWITRTCTLSLTLVKYKICS